MTEPNGRYITEPPLPVASPPTYLLLIDSRVSNYQEIINAKQSGVYHIVFDATTRPTHSTKLIKDIEDKIAELGVSAFTSIGLVQHNDGRPIYEMFGRISDRMKPVISTVATSDPGIESWQRITLFITMLRLKYGIQYFDMMACALYSNPNWKYVIDKLTILTGVTVRASTDDTGAASLGGDWFLESHTGVNLKNLYFTEAIENYTGVLYTASSQPTSATTSSAAKKLILIDHRIKDIDVIINSMNHDTYCLVFNYFYDTSATILSKLRFLNGNNRYILDNFYYEPPTLPTRMDPSGNHCTPCDDFDTNDIQLVPGILENEYLEYTMSGGDASGNGGGVWPFYSESTNITIQKPVFFQRAKIGETMETVPHGSTDGTTVASFETVVLNYKQRPMVLVSDLDAFYELGQNVGEIGSGPVTFDCVGIIQHTTDPSIGYKFVGESDESVAHAIVQDVVSRDSSLSSWAPFTAFIQSMKTAHQMTTLDLMACALYSDPDWKYVIDTLSVRENITIRASLDNTGYGSAEDDANWVLETDNVSLTTVYFTDKIYDWKYVLATYIDSRFNALRWNNNMYASRSYDPRLKIAEGTNSFTIEAWYYETTAQSNATIVDMGMYNYLFQVRTLGNNYISLYNYNTGWIDANIVMTPGQWNHIAVTRSGSTFTFYLNGTARQVVTNSTSFYSSNGTFTIGLQSIESCFCNLQKTDSVLYDIRLWNVARTASEIQMNRNRIVPANSTGLVANYLCTDNGSTFNDRSVNALHATIQNYDSSRWSNSTVTIPNIGFLINNGYSLRTSNTATALNAFTHFDNITYTDFSGVDLSGVNFRGADLTGCNFTNANLTNTNFTNAYLVNATTTNAITTGSNIAQAITNLTSTVLHFDGIDDAVNIGVPAWTYSTQFRTTMTVECWFKTADTNNQKIYTTLVTRNNSGGNSSLSQFALYIQATGEIGFGLTNTANTGIYHTTSLSYKDALWHHAASTYDSVSGEKKIYIDGVLTNSDTVPSGYGLLSNNTTTRLIIGNDDNGTSPNSQSDRQFRGAISDVRIWNVVRSPAEIAANYQRRLIGNETGLVGYWKLNHGYGTGWATYSTAIDSTSNRAHGTLINMGATPSGSWVVSNINFQPRISTLLLGANNGVYNADSGSFTFIDPSSNGLGNFTYDISPTTVATVANGAATTKTIYATSGAISIPTLSLYDFPEIASLSSWQIDVSFTVTGGSGTWRALVGDMYNNVNSFRGWGLWVSAYSPPKIHWSWMDTTVEPLLTPVGLNTPYILTVAQSNGEITLTLRNVSGAYNTVQSISNLVAAYSFDSTSNDTSVNNNHLTNMNTVTYNTSDYKRGTAAASFNGSSYYEIANDGRFSPDNFTVACWVKPVTSVGQYQTIAACRTGGGGWSIYITPSNHLEFWTGNYNTTFSGPNETLYWSFGTISQWVHLTFTINKSTGALLLYINGILFTSTTRDYNNNTVTSLRIGAGANEGGAQFFAKNGTLMDDFRFYSKVLTADEIATLVADSSYSSSFSVGSNVIGKGPVTIGGWQNYSGENFPGTISYVNVSVPTNQRVVTLSSGTDGTPATVTATQDSYLDIGKGTQTASLTVNRVAPTFSTSFANMTKTYNHSFAFDVPISNSTGAFSFTSSNTSVATINPAITINALQFNGTTNFVDFGANITELGKASFTIECWIKTNGTAMGLLNCQNSDTNWEVGEKSLYIDGNGIPAFVGYGNQWIYSTVAVNDNIWHHIAVTWSYSGGTSGTGAFYIDGINRTSTNYSSYGQYIANHNNAGTFVFGKPNYAESTNFFNGAVCELRIWNVARSATELFQNYRRLLVGNESGLVAYHRFNQGVASGSNTEIVAVSNNSLNKVYTGILSGNFTLTGSSSNWVSGVSIRPETDVNVISDGETTITATQETSNIYTSRSTTATLTVTKPEPTIGSLSIPSKLITDAAFNLTDPTSNIRATSTITSTASVMIEPPDINTLIYGSSWTKLGADIDGEGSYDQSGFTIATSADGTIIAIGAIGNNPVLYNGHVRVYRYNSNKTSSNALGPAGWDQLGGDIDGENAYDYSGRSVSLSANGTILAIGASYNDGINGADSGHVRVFNYNPSKTSADSLGPAGWDQLGGDIDGEAAGDQSGGNDWNPDSVKLSADGTIVAIGGVMNSGSATYAGHVRVYKYVPSKTVAVTNQSDPAFGPVGWTRLGADIDGEAAYNYSGYSVGLSADGTTVAIGAWANSDGGTQAGHVRVYRYTPNKTVAVTNQSDAAFGPIGWTRLGADIDGKMAYARSGTSVAIAADGNTVAIGAHFNDSYRGNVRIFKYNASKTSSDANGPVGWDKTGDIDGEAYGEFSGDSISISADGTIVSIGARLNGGNGANSGHVRIYKYTPSKLVAVESQTDASYGPIGWTRLGIDIDGEFAGDQLVRSALSSDGTTIVVGAFLNDGTTGNADDNRGSVRVYNISTTNRLTYSSSNSAVADICGNILMIKGVNGTSTITASQTANTVYGRLNVSGTTYTLQYNPSTYTSSNTSVATTSTDGTITIVGVGTTTITTSHAETRSYSSKDVTGSLVVSGIAPTIGTLTAPAKNFGDAQFSLTAPSSNSDGAFSYTSSNTSVATVTSGGTVTIVGAGSTTITATQAASSNGYYTGGSSVTASLVVSPIAPTIGTLTAPAKNFGDASFNLTAPSSNSDGAFSYTSSNTSVATVTTGGTVTVVGAGSTTITATQAATTNYTGGSSVTASLVVSPIAPTIGTLTAPAKNFGDASFNLTAPSSNSDGAFSYTSSNTSVATVTTGGTVTVVGAGSTTITATQAASSDGNYASGSSVTASLVVSPIAPTIGTLTVPAKNFGDASFNLTAPSSNSDGAFSYTSSNTSVATVTSGGMVTLVGAGSTTITATQAATTNYTGGSSVTASLVVSPVAPTIGTLTAPAKNFADASFNLTAPSSNSDGAFSYTSSNTTVATVTSGGMVTVVSAGSTTITATQAASSDGNYTAGSSVTASLVVSPIAPTIGTLTAPSKTIVDAQFSLTAPSSNSDGSFSYTSSNTAVATVTAGGTVTIVGVGSTTITATQAASSDGNYASGSSVTASLVISGIAPTISLFTVPAKNFGDASFNFEQPFSNSNGAFSYTSSNTAVATVTSDGTITIVGAGNTTITATQAASSNGYYKAGSSVTAIFVVSPIAPTIGSFSVPAKRFGDASFNLTVPSSNSNGAFSYSSDNTSVATVSSSGRVTIVGAGNTNITVTQAASSNGNYTGGSSVTALLIVSRIAPTISPWSISAVTFGNAPFTLTAPTSNSDGAFIYTSSNTAVATVTTNGVVTIVGAGSTTITANQNYSINYTNESSVSAVLVVVKRTPFISHSEITKSYGDASFNISPFSTNTDSNVFTITSQNTDIVTIFDVSNVAIRGVGVTTIDISQSETNNFMSGSTSVTVTISKGTPVLSAFTVSSGRTYGSAPFSALAYPTSVSNGTITYSSSDSSVATIDSSGIITLVKAGYVNFTATQQATTYYNSATKTSNTLTVYRQLLPLVRSSPTSSTINKTYGDSYFNVVATNDSNGGTITYETSNSSVAGIVGSATAGVISVVSVGTATITARRGQTDQYLSDPVSWTVEVERATTTLTGLTDLSYNVTAAPFTVTASSPSNGAITYSLQDPSSGVLTIHPTSGLVTLRSPGSAVIVASQAQGTLYYAPPSITATITVSSAGNALQGATITSTSSFASVNLEGATLTGAIITNTAFTSANLSNANLTNAVIVSANFASADLSGATLSGATITGATFTSASLKNVDLSGAVLTSSVFTGSDLSGARLNGVDASGASFANAKLNNVNLSGANISNVNFTNTSIKGAVIEDVSFSPLQKLQLLKNSENRDIGQIIIPEVTGSTVLAAISESSPLRSIQNLDLTTATVAVVVPTTSTSPNDILPDVVLNVTSSDKFYLPINESEFFQIEGVKYYASGGIVRNYITNAAVEVISYNGTSVWLLAGSIVGLVLQTNTLNTSSFVVPQRKLITDLTPFMPTTLPTSNNTETPIVYSSNNTNVATINPSTGQITVTGNAIGFVRFTASQVQNAIYEPATSVSNTLFVDRAITFSLTGLNQTINLSTLATLDASSISVETTDATAVFYVRLSDMNNIFMYQSDASDINNVNAADVKYYVFHRKWPTELKLNPSHAMMNKTESAGMLGVGLDYRDDKSLVKHDFVRYIALRLFNTIHAVDLFNNENELLENFVFSGETVLDNINTIISEISTTSSNAAMPYDTSGNKYLTNDASGNTNLCREIMRHMAATAPSRFYNNIPNHAGLKNIPFQENDTIQYKVVIQAAASQNLLTGVSVIPSRSYTIKLVLKNTVSSNANTTISDSEMYPNSYPYSSSVTTYLPTSASSGVYNIYSPPAPIPFSRFGYNGWYYTNSTTWVNVAPDVRNHIKWMVGANTGVSKVRNLQYVRINLKIHNSASLPYLMIYTQTGSSRKYAVVSGDGSLVNGTVYSFYMNFNSYAREPAYINHTNAVLAHISGSGNFAGDEGVTHIALESDTNASAANVEFTLSSMFVGELSDTNINSEKEYGFQAAVLDSYP